MMDFLPLDQLIARIDARLAGMTGAPAQGSEPEAEKGKARYIRFSAADTQLAAPLEKCLEIGHLPQITPLPNLPSWLLGVSNIRGEILSMVDLKGFFHWPTRRASPLDMFIVVSDRDMKTALVVDRVLGIFSEAATDRGLTSNPFKDPAVSGYLSGVFTLEGQMVALLNPEALLFSGAMQQVSR